MKFSNIFLLVSSTAFFLSCTSANKKDSQSNLSIGTQSRNISSDVISPVYSFNDTNEQAYAYRGYMGFCAHPSQIPMTFLADIQNGMRKTTYYKEDAGDTLERYLQSRDAFIQAVATGVSESERKSYNSESDASFDDLMNEMHCRVIVRAKDYISKYGCYSFKGEQVISQNSNIFQSCNSLIQKLKPFIKK